MTNKEFDIAVIGSGPGGYVAAIRAAQLGYKVAIIEKYPVLGGTCTNVGCIPSKALLDSSEHYHQAASKFEQHGIELSSLSIDFQQFMKRKNDVVKSNTDGIKLLMNKNKITVIQGLGSFVDSHTLSIRPDNGDSFTIRANHVIIATGSKPSSIPGVEVDKKHIITSTEALYLKEQPDSLTLIGGGVIGAEMASIFARIGTQVTILEYAGRLIPNMDKDLSKELKKSLKKLGVDIINSAQVKSAKSNNGVVSVDYSLKGASKTIESDKVLVATGRSPFTNGLQLHKAGVNTDPKGFITVNDNLQTSQSNIWAIGDVVGGAMLAHKAEEEGVAVAERIDGQKPHINYSLIPNVVYTWPEVASVGSTEEQLKDRGVPYRVGKFPVSASGRARAANEHEGVVKVLSEPKYGEVLGVHIIGPRAADLIAQAVVAMEYEVTDEDMTLISYAHPTYSEMLKEAYLGASQKGTLNI